MLTKAEVIEAVQKAGRMVDTEKRIILKVVVYSYNPLAPEKIAYKLYYSDVFGVRRKCAYYPNSVGVQG